MIRLPDWEPRLAEYLAKRHGVHFTWGATDCCLFAADAVIAMTGEDPATAFRGRYTTARGATRALKRYGAGTIEATLDTMFGQIRTAFARRGDLVMCAGMVGICVGGAALFVGEENGAPGLVRFDRSAWAQAWAVG